MSVVVIVLLVVGMGFMVAGTLGLLRFPDLPTRLHAVAKADNLGLGLIALALIVQVLSTEWAWGTALKLALIWLLALVGTAVNGHLLARRGTDQRHTDQLEDDGSEGGS
ncbi:hypothetical protein K8P10_002021 [Leucobacter sp. Psy1]|uniref:cation:proton antiporter n=1 Tax=Leucobacter sp. Psy1 TaxID=2875729 RepID=UPI001CD592C9|nr:monovalent cation/H(+) antiporter subunit G [Leucobacter sp. Psy1]UBH06510.1 hypothetical protein K8P10_002021 [Leucobacter sp. Psy1]